jgi:hypothetical protein
VDALKAQEQDPAARELSFVERLGMLVDQQWTWRENQPSVLSDVSRWQQMAGNVMLFQESKAGKLPRKSIIMKELENLLRNRHP